MGGDDETPIDDDISEEIDEGRMLVFNANGPSYELPISDEESQAIEFTNFFGMGQWMLMVGFQRGYIDVGEVEAVDIVQLHSAVRIDISKVVDARCCVIRVFENEVYVAREDCLDVYALVAPEVNIQMTEEE